MSLHSPSASPFDAAIKMEVDQEEGLNVRAITVTLVYPRAWWRPILAAADGYADVGVKPEPLSDGPHKLLPPRQFALLPPCRLERGFCHTFCDLSPKVCLLIIFFKPTRSRIGKEVMIWVRVMANTDVWFTFTRSRQFKASRTNLTTSDMRWLLVQSLDIKSVSK